MAQPKAMDMTRSDLKRKAFVALSPTAVEPAGPSTLEEAEAEIEFQRTYGRGVVRIPNYERLVGGATRLIREGAAEWTFDLDLLRRFYQDIHTYARYWASQYLIGDIDHLPRAHIRRLIARLDGFCVQIDWKDLRPQLPPTAVANLGQILGQLLIHLTIHERLFENPFWYLDGKEGPDDQEDDPKFARKLKYLFDRFYETNPTYGVLWKMQTQRLANSCDRHYAPNPVFGQYNADRHEAALAGFSDDLMASEPFCWLLKDGCSSGSVATERRENLIDIFRKAVRCMIKCETWTNGQPVLRGINELGGVYRGHSGLVALHHYCWRPRMELYNDQKILLVTRPGLVYVDGVTQWTQRPPSKVTEVIEAEILPVFVKTEGGVKENDTEDVDEEVEDTEEAEEQGDEDKSWVEGASD